MIYRLILFLVINFSMLALGGLFTGKGVSSDWYNNLNQAPWTPPGWVFGVAWTSIMIFFSFYLSYVWPLVDNKKLFVGLFLLQCILNFSWNPVFFHFQNPLAGFIVITLLTALIGFLLYYYWTEIKFKSLLILPYFLWLLIATSLNGYILFKN